MLRQGLPVPTDPRVWREATTLARAGYDVTVVAQRSPGQPARERLDGVDVRRYRCREGHGLAGLVVESLAALWGCLRHLVALRLRGRIDVLHAFNPPDTLALLAHLLPGVPLVYDQADPVPELLAARGSASPLLARVLSRAERAVLRRANRVIAVNTTCRDLVLGRGAGLSPEQVVVVRIGRETLPPPAPPYPGVPVVTFAGVMGSQDGVELLLRAVAALLGRRPGACVVDLVGDGPDVPRLQRLAASLGVEHAVTWTGWLSGSAYVERLARAAVCVSPDEDTPFNRLATMVKITDYLALGRACVVADLPETRVTCEDAVRYVPAGDPAALADALEQLLDDPAERDRLGAAAARRAPRLLWEHSAQRLVALYDELTRGGPPVTPEQRP